MIKKISLSLAIILGINSFYALPTTAIAFDFAAQGTGDNAAIPYLKTEEEPNPIETKISGVDVKKTQPAQLTKKENKELAQAEFDRAANEYQQARQQKEKQAQSERMREWAEHCFESGGKWNTGTQKCDCPREYKNDLFGGCEKGEKILSCEDAGGEWNSKNKCVFASVTGTLRDQENAALGNATIKYNGKTDATNHDGSFNLKNIEQGTTITFQWNKNSTKKVTVTQANLGTITLHNSDVDTEKTKENNEKLKAACEKTSFGTWKNGKCNCKSGYELTSGGTCVMNDKTSQESEEWATNMEECEDAGGEWNSNKNKCVIKSKDTKEKLNTNTLKKSCKQSGGTWLSSNICDCGSDKTLNKTNNECETRSEIIELCEENGKWDSKTEKCKCNDKDASFDKYKDGCVKTSDAYKEATAALEKLKQALITKLEQLAQQQ